MLFRAAQYYVRSEPGLAIIYIFVSIARRGVRAGKGNAVFFFSDVASLEYSL